jgi:hypothetical protein
VSAEPQAVKNATAAIKINFFIFLFIGLVNNLFLDLHKNCILQDLLNLSYLIKDIF